MPVGTTNPRRPDPKLPSKLASVPGGLILDSSLPCTPIASSGETPCSSAWHLQEPIDLCSCDSFRLWSKMPSVPGPSAPATPFRSPQRGSPTLPRLLLVPIPLPRLLLVPIPSMPTPRPQPRPSSSPSTRLPARPAQYPAGRSVLLRTWTEPRANGEQARLLTVWGLQTSDRRGLECSTWSWLSIGYVGLNSPSAQYGQEEALAYTPCLSGLHGKTPHSAEHTLVSLSNKGNWASGETAGCRVAAGNEPEASLGVRGRKC